MKRKPHSRSQGYIKYSSILLILALCVTSLDVYAQARYKVQPGDALTISVWKEPDLSGVLTVHPDGMFSMPLVGEIQTKNKSIQQVQESIAEKLKTFVPDAIVTVGLNNSVGASIYVIGQVNTPGVFTVSQPTDVMQALSLAQGMTAYAAKNKIKILRRNSNGQQAIKFRYGDVAKGEGLEQNIVLQNGDVVVVP